MKCCGVCHLTGSFGGAVALCKCELCACGHCLHKHEKWRWHRLCSVCTPIAYKEEYPNEIDPRELGENEDDDTLDGYGPELDKHRPGGEP